MKSSLASFAAMVGTLLVLVAVVVPAIAFLAGQIGQRSVAAAAALVFAIGILAGVLLLRLAAGWLRQSRVLQIGVGTTLAVCVAMLVWAEHLGAFERSRVSLEGGVLLIQGRLDDEALISFSRLLESTDLRDVRVRLRSAGGNIYVAMAMGREIHHRQLDVEVQRRCISSCANYLFTAGRNKYLHAADEVQFHGGALQPDFVAAARELLRRGKQMDSGEDVPDAARLRELYGLVDGFPFNAAASILAEKAFFDEIGVSSLTPVYGQYGDYSAWFNDGVHDKFAYLPDDYAMLGVENVILTGSGSGMESGSRLFRARTSMAIVNALQAETVRLYQEIEAAMPFGTASIWTR